MFNTNGHGHFRLLGLQDQHRFLVALRSYDSPYRAKLEALFLILLNYGSRVSEACRLLRRQDVDFRAQTITFQTLKRFKRLPDGRKVRLHIPRILPLLPPVAAAIRACLPVEGPADQPIIGLDRRRAYRVFRVVSARAGLSRHRVYDCRHTALSRLLEQTGDLAFVRDVAGHANISTTSVYVHCRNMRERFLSVPAIG